MANDFYLHFILLRSVVNEFHFDEISNCIHFDVAWGILGYDGSQVLNETILELHRKVASVGIGCWLNLSDLSQDVGNISQFVENLRQ